VVVEVVVVVAVVVVVGAGLVVVGVGAVVVGDGLVVPVGLVEGGLAGVVAGGDPAAELELDLTVGGVVVALDPPETTAPVGGDEPSWAAV